LPRSSSSRPTSPCSPTSPGCIAYNLAHTYALALALTLAGFLAGVPAAAAGGLIWIAHIGFDRALGYGLKYSSGFGDTHLGRIGRR
jgi:hypothetical protein